MIKNIKIGIIDCNFGNIASLINSIKFLGYDYKVINETKKLNDISHLILPGVGSFNEAAKKLRNSGWSNEIKEFVTKSKPFLGICLGMQLLFESSSENGEEQGLGLFEGKCEKFSKGLNLSLPHIGFNLVDNPKTKIWKNIPNKSPFYFVHSFRVPLNGQIKKKESKSQISKTFYGENFISFIEEKNIFGAQFHPEKSHKLGLNLIKNFAEETK